MTSKGTWKYVDKLEDLVRGYNSSVHRSIGMAPKDATDENAPAIFAKLFKGHPYADREKNVTAKRPKYKYAVGDKVRVSEQSNQFTKSYKSAWSQEIFVVTKRLVTAPPTYVVEDLTGESVTGSFYEQEMQLVHPTKISGRVHGVRADRRGRKRMLVERKGGKKEWLYEANLS